MDTDAPIRQAIAADDFAAAMRLWNEYAEGVQQEIRSGTCTAARMAAARELLEWSQFRVRCACAHFQSRLRAIQAAGQYSAAQCPRSTLLHTSL
jgi:hypothetical protein